MRRLWGMCSRPELESESIIREWTVARGCVRGEQEARSVAARERLKSSAFLPSQAVLDQLDALLHALHVGVDGERALEVLERPLQLAALDVDQTVTGQRAEVVGIAPDDFVAVVQGLVEISHQVVRGGTLVPSFRELGANLDGAGEGVDRRTHPAVVHVMDTAFQQRVRLRVPGPAPDAPHGDLRQAAHALVLVEQRFEQARRRRPSCLPCPARPRRRGAPARRRRTAPPERARGPSARRRPAART